MSRSFHKDNKLGEKFQKYIPCIITNFLKVIQEERNTKLTVALSNYEVDPKLQRKGLDATILKSRTHEDLFNLEKRILESSFDLKTYNGNWYKQEKSDIFLELYHTYLDENDKPIGTSKGWFWKLKTNVLSCWRDIFDEKLIAGYLIFLQNSELRKFISLHWQEYPCILVTPTDFIDDSGKSIKWQTTGLLVPIKKFPEDTLVEIPEYVFSNCFDGGYEQTKDGLYSIA